ncbi:hypothetical protein WMY93_008154 [Mugilogobius chulae]|uniref:Pentraxin family member n=1 Tax=Mugilogobius chulae TaxID=88201 RepID=A0AAW0PTR3_9GOBI
MKLLICFVVLLSVAATTLCRDMSREMFTFPQQTNTAHVKMSPSRTTFRALTVCHRSFTDLTRDHGLFSLSTPKGHNSFLTFWNAKNKQMEIYILQGAVPFPSLDYAPNKWHSICATFDSRSGVAQLWFDGKPLVRKYIKNTPIIGRPIITLGQEQDTYGGGFDVNQSFVGMMTDVHMWSYVLSPHQIRRYMRRHRHTPGNVVNWDALSFTTSGRVLIERKQ